MASNGVYGINIPVRVSANDIDIFYSYSPHRNSDSMEKASFIKLDSNLLSEVKLDTSVNGYDNVLEGVYNLKLPLQYFGAKGFYNIYIRPKEIPAILQDVGTLTTFPDVKGLIIDSTQHTDNDTTFKAALTTANGLVGYRVIYLDDNNNRQDYYRIVTSNNRVEPVVQNMVNANQKAVRYRYNTTSNLVFITVTPSVSSTFKPNSEPYIGRTSQKVLFVNTLFEPILIELEMVDHDADTISTMLEGSQLRDLDNSLITTFDENNEIYNQQEFYTLKDDATFKPMYEVRKNKTHDVDLSQTIEDK